MALTTRAHASIASLTAYAPPAPLYVRQVSGLKPVVPPQYLYATSSSPDFLGMAVVTERQLHTIPIASRPRRTWAQTAHGILFLVVFLFACLMTNGCQFLFLLPLKLLPFRRARKLYYEGIRYTKGSFGALLGTLHVHSDQEKYRGLSRVGTVLAVLSSQWFAPTELVISFETEGQGKFSPEELETLVERDKNGKVVSLNLPQKTVFIANHQVCPMAHPSTETTAQSQPQTPRRRYTWTGGMHGR